MFKIILIIAILSLPGLGFCLSIQVNSSISRAAESGVHLDIHLDGLTNISELKLYRTHSISVFLIPTLDPEAILYPIFRKKLKPTEIQNGWSDQHLADGTTYYYFLQAKLTNGTTVRSNFAVVTTKDKALELGLGAAVLIIDKENYIMQVSVKGKILKSYPVVFGGNPNRRKLEADHQSTPEGIYSLDGLRPEATYYRAMDLNYPNSSDRARYAVLSKDRQLGLIGGSIQIHGKKEFYSAKVDEVSANWTEGCIAMKNAALDELFASNYLNSKLRIALFGGELERETVLSLLERPQESEILKASSVLVERALLSQTRSQLDFEMKKALCRYQQKNHLEMTCELDRKTKTTLLGWSLPVR